MSKKLIFMTFLLIVSILTFGITFSFAANDNTTGTGNYTTSRTDTAVTTRAATPNAGTFLGMNSTTWTWVVLAIAVVAIVALVWYYSNQITNNRRYDNGE